MGLKEEVLEMKKEVQEIQEQSFAMELLKDQKKQNKRQFIIILVILGMWFATIGYLVYVLNDIGTTTEETTTQEVTDFDTINGNIVTALQEPQLGTGHAVMQAQKFIDKHLDDDILILNGDGPLMDAETINKAYDYHKENGNSITLISALVDDTNSRKQ